MKSKIDTVGGRIDLNLLVVFDAIYLFWLPTRLVQLACSINEATFALMANGEDVDTVSSGQEAI